MGEILIKNRLGWYQAGTYKTHIKKLVSYVDTSFFIFSNSNFYFITTGELLKFTRYFYL